MGTTAQKLNKILETKEAIRTAINNKGGTLTTTDTFASYSSAIDNLPSGGGGSLKTLLDATKTSRCLFYNYKGTSVNDLITYSDTSSVKDMRSMFEYCSNLTTIPQLDTSNANDMYQMFYECKNLTTISQLYTRNVTTMMGMFYNCQNLTTIPQLDTSNVTAMYQMFENCYKLATIDITHMNTTSEFSGRRVAYNCFSLTKFIIRNMTTLPKIGSDTFSGCDHFTGEPSSYNPQGLKDGRIYVPDDKVDALKTATNWSTYADIIVGLSTLQE